MSRHFRGLSLPEWFEIVDLSQGKILPVGYVFSKEKMVPGQGKSDKYQRLSLTMQGVLPRSREATDGLQPESFDNYQLLKPGQLVFKLIDLQNVSTSRVGISSYEGLVSPAYLVLQPSSEVHPKYAYWYFMDLYFRRVFNKLGEDGVRASLPWEGFKELPFFLPPLDKQRHIANYLDEETAKIDQLISRKVDLFRLVDEGSTAGKLHLFHDLESRYNSLPIKRLLRKVQRQPLQSDEIVTAYDDGEVVLRSRRRLDGYWNSDNEVGYQRVEVGDFVFHGLDGYRGAVGISADTGKMTPACHICVPTGIADPLFIVCYLRFLAISGYMKTQSMTVRGDSMDFRNWAKLGSIKIPIPPIEVQVELARQFLAYDGDRSQLVATTEEFRNLLLERRSALITAAVTGQLEV